MRALMIAIAGFLPVLTKGSSWDVADALGVSELKKRNHLVGLVSPAMGAKVGTLLEPIEAGWVGLAETPVWPMV